METKEKILKSARRLLVSNGFNGTSLSKIAKNANVSKSLVMHYFDNKDEIWLAVRSTLTTNHIENQREGLESENLITFFTLVFENKLNHSSSNSDFIRFKLWEFLEKKRPNFSKGFISEVVSFLKEKQVQGFMRQDVHIESVIVLFFSATEYWKIIDRDLAKTLGVSIKELEVMYKKDLIKIILDGLKCK